MPLIGGYLQVCKYAERNKQQLSLNLYVLL